MDLTVSTQNHVSSYMCSDVNKLTKMFADPTTKSNFNRGLLERGLFREGDLSECNTGFMVVQLAFFRGWNN